MHRFAAALLSVIVAAPAAATVHHKMHTAPVIDPCVEAADRYAFDVLSLKSELTVAALTCKKNDGYNAFMATYKPAVLGANSRVTAYFKRVYGRQYQHAYDDYITNLAGVQEQDTLKSGTAFCDAYAGMFDEVLALHDETELADYAHSQAIAQPISLESCAAAPAKATKLKHRVMHKKKA
jgi:hypothetical protein